VSEPRLTKLRWRVRISQKGGKEYFQNYITVPKPLADLLRNRAPCLDLEEKVIVFAHKRSRQCIRRWRRRLRRGGSNLKLKIRLKWTTRTDKKNGKVFTYHYISIPGELGKSIREEYDPYWDPENMVIRFKPNTS